LLDPAKFANHVKHCRTMLNLQAFILLSKPALLLYSLF
jgi:hypothetical protein